MPDKDKNDNVDHKKMQKEQNLEKKAYNMLIKEYGYSKSQIREQYPVEFDGKKINDINDYSRVLGGIKIGKPTKIVIMRRKKKIELKITPGMR